MPLSLTAAGDDNGRRLDRILRKALPELPLSAIHRLLRRGLVHVNGKPCTADYRVQCGQTITVNDIASRPSASLRLNETKSVISSLEIIFEGGGLLFLNKPAGLQVHGRGSLEELVLSYLTPKLPTSLSFKPGPLHRLDRPSSGLITFSTSIDGARFFSSLMRERKIKKQYLAIVKGAVEKAEFWQDELVRDKDSGKTFLKERLLQNISFARATAEKCMFHSLPGEKLHNLGKTNPNRRFAVLQEAQDTAKTENAKMAITKVRPVMSSKAATLIAVDIETGRTHQIRVQAAAHGHPLLGDRKYGGGNICGEFLLHAWRMEFPEDGMAPLPHLIEAPLPENFKEKIEKLFGEEFNPGVLEI